MSTPNTLSLKHVTLQTLNPEHRALNPKPQTLIRKGRHRRWRPSLHCLGAGVAFLGVQLPGAARWWRGLGAGRVPRAPAPGVPRRRAAHGRVQDQGL